MSESETNKGAGGESIGSEGALILETPAEKVQREAAEEKERDKKRRKLQFVFNGMVAITGALTVAVLIYQAHIMNRTLNQVAIQATAAQTSADAAGRAAASAETAATVASQSLEIGERAYITVDSDSSPSFSQFGPDKQVILRIQYVNTGHSPATAVIMGVQKVIVSEDDPEKHVKKVVIDAKKLSSQIHKGGVSEGVIPPGKSGFGSGIGDLVSAGDFRKVMEGKLFLGVHGEIFYKDVFGKDRSTEYCFVFLNGGAFAFCHKYNRIN